MAKTTTRTLKDLKRHDKNPRTHDERNLGMIEDSLRELGTGRSILIDEHDVVIAGNGTVEAAKRAGLTKVIEVEADADTIVAVKRRGMTDEQKQKMSVADNRTAELAEWDKDVLSGMRDSGMLDDMFTGEELAAVLGEADEDDAAPITPITIERPKEVAWILIAVPLESWPQNQAHVEALQNASVFTSMAMRPKE